MKSKITSDIFSLRNSFEYCPSEYNCFLNLGSSSMGTHHIAIFCRNVVNSVLYIDYENVVQLNPFCSAYNIVNKRNSIYGTLFCVDISKVVFESRKLIVSGIEQPVGDFNLYPYANDRSNLLFFKDSSNAILVIVSVPDNNPFIVLDD